MASDPERPADEPVEPAPGAGRTASDPERPADVPIEKSGLSVRARNILGRARVLTLSEVAALHESELRALPNLGEKTLREVIDKLAEHGLTTRTADGRTARDRPVGTHGASPSPSKPRPAAPGTEVGERGGGGVDVIRRLAAEGTASTEIAQHLGLSEDWVTWVLHVGSGSPEETAQAPAAPNRDARLDKIVRLRKDGHTLAEIASRFGVTRERIRQLLRAAESSVDSEAVRSAQRSEAARRVSDELLAGFRAGRESTEVAREHGVTVSAANQVIRELVTEADRAERSRSLGRRRGPGTTYSREELIGAVQEVASRVGRVPTSNDYSDQASRSGLPSLPTVTNRLGGWANAVRAAGMTPHVSARRNYERRWPEERCWLALQRIVTELGEVPTAEQYALLASADDDLPSLATVRNRLGRWSEVMAQLSVDLHSDPNLRRLGVSRRATDVERDEAIWLAYLEGEVSDDEIEELLRAGLFTWDPSYGPRPGT